MRARIVIIPAILFAIMLTGCKKESKEQDLTPKDLEFSQKSLELVGQSNSFGIDLFTGIAADEDGNMMLSPLSASTALTMLLNGSGGNSFDQLRDMLNWPESMTIAEINSEYKKITSALVDADPKVVLTLANAMFYRNDFVVKTPFRSVLESAFDAEVAGLDFNLPQAVTTINKWASDNTAGKIPTVLDEISDDAVLFLMNALYFKGDWSYSFDKSQTEMSPFTPDGAVVKDVTMMKSKVGAKMVYINDHRAVEMPYGRTNFTMTIVVPQGTVAEFTESFDSGLYGALTNSLDSQAEFDELEVWMPKFSFSYEKLLNDQLKSMGMTDLFDPAIADLSGISDDDIFVDFVKQNTFIDVDEKGTEAAAVTTVGVSVTSFPPPTTIFKIDESFIFIIRERTTNTILFIGKVIDPS